MKKLIILMLFIGLLGGVIFSSRLIQIKGISCESQYGPCSPDITKALEGVTLSNLQESRKNLEAVLQKNKKIKKYVINYTFPKTLKAQILERKPQVAVLRKNATNYILVDKEGIILEESENTPLPIITIAEVGHTSDELTFAANLQYELFTNFNVNSSIMNEDHLFITKDGIDFLFPLKGDLDEILGSYNLILSWLKSEKEESRIEQARSVTEIDLRYKNPVMRI